MTLGKRSLLLLRPSSIRPSVHHPEAALCRFYLLTASPERGARPSVVRRIKRRANGGDGVISEQSPSIKLIMVTAGPPVADEDDGEQEMAEEDGQEEEGAVAAVRSFAWIQEVQLA